MEAAHSQLTVYRLTAFVPGQRITVVFNRAKSQSAEKRKGKEMELWRNERD